MTKHRANIREDILEYIQAHTQKVGYPPSVGEMANHFDTVKSNIFHHLVKLEEEGVLRHVPGKARSWVTQASPD